MGGQQIMDQGQVVMRLANGVPWQYSLSRTTFVSHPGCAQPSSLGGSDAWLLVHSLPERASQYLTQ